MDIGNSQFILVVGIFSRISVFNWSPQYLWLHHTFHSMCFLCVFLLPWPISEVCLYLVFCEKSDFGFVFLDCVFCFTFVFLSCCFDYSDDFLSLVRCFLLCFWCASSLFVAIYLSVSFSPRFWRQHLCFHSGPFPLLLERYLHLSLCLFLTVLCVGFSLVAARGPTV